ncbi:MAG: BMP family ABC transporter substrate-binding protein [Clostridiales bacterium]|nr:BMP family ABC transporter substrate-binding protein [Clostridiales bacterium]
MKKIVKIIALVLSVSMLFAMAACGGGNKQEPKKNDIKVGIMHITSKDDTSGYTYAHQKGFMEMVNNIGLTEDNYVIKDSISDTDVTATKQALQELVDADCDIIFATSYNYMDTVESFAAENPDIIFSHCSGYKSNETNFNNYFGRIYEARYLSGIAAGLKAKELGNPMLGYVAAMDSTNSEVTGGIDAFALGAQSVYPEAQVKVKVTGSWYDPEGETAAAKALIDAGCCVIAQHCDTDGPQTTARDAGVFGCGYNSDMTDIAPTSHLCAPVWNWGAYYTDAVQKVIDGTWKAVNYYEGMKAGLIDLSPINEAIAAPGTKEAVETAKAQIIDGSLIVFNQGIVKADGTVIDHALTDAEITGGINYYLQGVSLL